MPKWWCNAILCSVSSSRGVSWMDVWVSQLNDDVESRGKWKLEFKQGRLLALPDTASSSFELPPDVG